MEALSVRILYSEEMRPNHFFVRTKMQAKVFDKIDSHLQDYFKLDPNLAVPQLQQNDLMACFVDGRYFRSKFLRLDRKTKLPVVYLVDVGRKLKVSFKSCYQIPLAYVNFNACALQCHLNIVPSIGNDWTAENGLDYFKKICYERQFGCRMVFREKPRGQESANVDLTWEELKMDGPFSLERKITCFMSQELVSKNFAKMPMTEIEDVFEHLDLTEENQNSCTDPDITLPEETGMTPITKWPPSEIPLGPLEDFQQIRVTHVDEYGQIVRISA